ncbi:unnamed protein product, partial [Polarella glacialis]
DALDDSESSRPVLTSPFGELPWSGMLRNGFAGPLADVTVALLVLGVSAAFALRTLGLAPEVDVLLVSAEDVAQVLFAVEYLLRWYSRDCRPSYLLKWTMLVDGLAFLPLVLGMLGIQVAGDQAALEFLRLLRILRLLRFLRD